MDLREALRSTGAVREFRQEPVPDQTVYRILEAARFAPSGGNRQGWRVIVVRSPGPREALRDLYLEGWYEYLAMSAAGLVPWAPITNRAQERQALVQAPQIRASSAAGPGGFAEHLDRVPVLLLVLADLRALASVDRDLDRYTFAGGASVYPFVWSLLLAARAEGLAGVITTMPIRQESKVKEYFAVPPELAVAALVALGIPEGAPRRLRRRTVEEFATVDAFSGDPLST